MDIIDKLYWRYATKKFDKNKIVPESDLETILESIRLTPSSYGLQPWKFLIIENQEIREKLKPISWGQNQITECSNLIVFSTIEKLDKKYIEDYIDLIAKTRGIDKKNLEGYENMMKNNLLSLSKEQIHSWAKNQVYIALGNAMTICSIMGIDSCPIEGFESEKYDEVLELEKKGLKSAVVLAIGYRSEDDSYSKLKKVRFSKENLFEKY